MAGDQWLKAIRRWLSPPDTWNNHHLAHECRHEATATWFVQGQTFSEWKSSCPSSLLWIHGKRQSLPSCYAFVETYRNYLFQPELGGVSFGTLIFSVVLHHET